ncbi:Ig-like domain (group 3), partial [Nitrosomonas marina]
ITITSPGSDSVVSGVVPVEVSYSDNVGVVSVDLYVNGQHYGQSTQEPFTFSLDTTVMDDGHNTLSAVALDAAGNQGSSGIAVSVNNGTTTDESTGDTPIISIASPVGGKVSGTIPIEFSYSNEAAIVSVDLYINDQLLGKNTQAPFNFTFDTTTVSDGSYTLTAHAFDEAGNKGVSANVSVTVQNAAADSTDKEAPIVTVASPSPGAEVSGTTRVEFETFDHVGIVRVELYANDVHVGSSTNAPFSIDWDTTQSVNGYGYLQAKAFDAAGNKGVSFYRNVTVNNSETATPADTQAPTINIASPASGTVSGTIPVNFNFSDNVGVVSVDLYVNGQLLGNNTQAPFNFTLDTTTVADGSYTLTAHAFDEAGNKGVSANVSVTVQNAAADSTDKEAPIVTVASPSPGAEVSGTTRVDFETFDHVGIVRVELYANDVHVGSSTNAPFSIDWDTTQSVNGYGYLQAKAFDAAGNKGVSFYRNVTVNNSETATPADTQAPTINIASPASGTVSGTIPVNFNSTDNVGVISVDLYVNGQLLGKNTQAPFNFTFDTTTVSDGSYTLTAHAFDEAGNKGVSANVTVTVQNAVAESTDKEAPIVTVASPSPGAEVSGTTRVEFETFDHVGIVRVELYANDVHVGSSTNAPFSIDWDTTQSVNGYGYLQAYAYDAAGNKGVSFYRNITVSNVSASDTTAPVISSFNLNDGMTLKSNTVINVSANDDQGVSQIALSIDGNTVMLSDNESLNYLLNVSTARKKKTPLHTIAVAASDRAGNTTKKSVNVYYK